MQLCCCSPVFFHSLVLDKEQGQLYLYILCECIPRGYFESHVLTNILYKCLISPMCYMSNHHIFLSFSNCLVNCMNSEAPHEVFFCVLTVFDVNMHTIKNNIALLKDSNNLKHFWVMTNLMHSFLMYLFMPLHISSSKCSSSGGPNCINTSSGITHSGE
jgi:hypothetical protein